MHCSKLRGSQSRQSLAQAVNPAARDSERGPTNDRSCESRACKPDVCNMRKCRECSQRWRALTVTERALQLRGQKGELSQRIQSMPPQSLVEKLSLVQKCAPDRGSGFHWSELLRVKCRKNGANWKIENSCRFHLQYSRKEKITEHKNTRQAERSLTVRISSRMEPRSFASRTNVKLHVVQQLSHKCIEKFAYAITRRETS